MNTGLPSVSIIIPTFNEEEYLSNCLRSVKSIDYPNEKYEVIVVDNGSEDSTLEIARSYGVKVYVKENIKVGAVRNFGAENSYGDVLVFLDGDCVVDKGWIRRGLELLDNNSVVGGQYFLRENPYWVEKYWILNPDGASYETSSLVGGCIMIRRDDFLKVGRFNESLNSGEDSELTHRLRRSGVNVRVTRQFSVTHLGYPTSLTGFVKRQIWHSIDYGLHTEKSFKDKIFILTSFYGFGLIFSVVGLLTSAKLLLIGLALALICPASLSVKRIRRSKYKGSLKDVFSIFLIDNAYLWGRLAGLLSGLLMRVRSRKGEKYFRG
ncbi:glycosyl transferase family 2 [Marinimicrobium koreense]|uniref:Glycosyl transferase family 2 n=1 Tax=Marinimicrobium koreense TaxID=306545 RepID=A0A3N1NPI9_9GAMM|nr:glycosyltransferase [Marinimicrobium koreense]ROQ18063.1 glycosyl transferase family 2 [Marinimicrobium koreense]